MEEGLRAVEICFSVSVFVMAMSILFIMQTGFESVYESVLEVINGGYIW